MASLRQAPPSVLGLLVQEQVGLRGTAEGFVAICSEQRQEISLGVWGTDLITQSPVSIEHLAETADKQRWGHTQLGRWKHLRLPCLSGVCPRILSAYLSRAGECEAALRTRAMLWGQRGFLSCPKNPSYSFLVFVFLLFYLL